MCIGLNCSRVKGASEKITLVCVATQLLQKDALGLGFNAFGDDRQIQTPCQCDHHLCQGRIAGVDHNVFDKALIYLQLAQRKSL